MPPPRSARPPSARASLALAVAVAAAALLAGCESTPREEETPWYVRGEIPVYEELVYWPQQDTGTDDGTQCLPLSELELGSLAREGTHEDLWARVRSGFALEGAVDERRVDSQYDRFGNPQRLFDAAEPGTEAYLHLVVQELEERNMPLELALLPMVESGYNPAATSRSQAAGMWQFVPGTGRRRGLEQNAWYDGRRDVVASTEAALDYLSELHQQFGGDWYLALAAYNAGEGSVQRAIERNRRLGKPTDYWSLPLSQQACNYVPKLLALSRVLESPHAHGVSLAPIPDAPAVLPVEVEEHVDLRRAADRAGIDRGELLRLNPALKRGATLPDGTTTLLVPAANRENFVAALNALPAAPSTHVEQYRVRPGDTLQSVARLLETTPEQLRALNQLKGDTIIAGEYLHLPREAVIPPRAFPTTESVDLKNRGIYVVKPGDSLWSIARRTGTAAAELERLNALAPGAVLQPGQQLRVRTESAPRLLTAQTDPANRQRIDYVVRSGDSLSSIASRFKVAVSELMRWNAIGARALIHPGQAIVVYIDPSLAARENPS